MTKNKTKASAFHAKFKLIEKTLLVCHCHRYLLKFDGCALKNIVSLGALSLKIRLINFVSFNVCT